MRRGLAALAMAGAVAGVAASVAGCGHPPTPRSPGLAIGESFTLASRALGERRTINVFTPTVYGQAIAGPLPVLYMPDGGLDEDFLHVAGLVQVLVSNGTMRPFRLVGIPSTVRRRDLTPPSDQPDDRAIAPVVGGAAAYRRFVADELMPAIRARYATADEAAIIGESLAGLFVLDTLATEPGLFTDYIAIDPSVWWADHALVRGAPAWLAGATTHGARVFIATSNEPSMAADVDALAAAVAAAGDGDLRLVRFADESHATIYHPAALVALRAVLAPAPAPIAPRAPR